MARTLIAWPVAMLVTLLATSPPAYGWGDVGHMMVAYAAYQDLTPATKTRVNALVQMNPKIDIWKGLLPADAPEADKPMMLFMIAATWADQIKHDGSHKADGSQGGDRPEGSKNPTANTGYGDTSMHKYWHFIDTPFTRDATPLPKVPTPNAQTQIKTFRGVLASNAKDPLKSYDLVWLLHLVGDIHQPLHCATRVNKASPKGDAGGNFVKLDCAKCELHAFWDDVPGKEREAAAIAPAITGAKALPKADPTTAAKSDEKDWVAESFAAAKQTAYQAPIGPGNGPFTLTSAYEGTAQTLVQERIALAGARLASLLNKELK